MMITLPNYPFSLQFKTAVDKIDSQFKCAWIFLLNNEPVPDGTFLQELESAGYAKHEVRRNITLLKSMTFEDLVCLALLEQQDGPALLTLLMRASKDTLTKGKSLLTSHSSIERALGVRILGGKVGSAFHEEAVNEVSDLAGREANETVIEQLAYSLYHLKVSERSRFIAPFVQSPHIGLRQAIAYSLAGESDQPALRCLIVLSEDLVKSVRFWATYGLSSVIEEEKDSQEIIDALYQRIDDEDLEVRGEAIIGLARRGDQRVCPYIQAALDSGKVNIPAVEAARDLGNPALLKSLISLRPSWSLDPDLLEEAIVGCTPQG